MAVVTYQVKLKNQQGEQVALFVGTGRGEEGGGLQALNYHKRLRTAGSWQANVYGDDERIDLFQLDGQVEFWRRDPVGGLDWYLDFEGFMRAWEWSETAEGQKIFIARGRGYNDLLAAEVIRYPAGSEQSTKSGPAETVAKEYVDENIGPSADPADRAMPGLAVEADAGTGATWRGGRANKNLLETLVELGDHAPADFMVVGTGVTTFEFQWRYPRWGLDKTRGNADGNPPIIFSSRHNNATNITYKYDRLDEVNVCYVGGGGKGEQRFYVTRTTGGEADSPWARRVIFRDARTEQTETGMNDKGDEALERQKPRHEFTFEVIQTGTTRYGPEGATGTANYWDWGDLVTVEYRGEDISQKVIGAWVTMDQNGVETIQPEVEDA